MKYLVKNIATGQECLCEKLEVDGFEYYYDSGIEPVFGVIVYSPRMKLVAPLGSFENSYSNECFPIFATTNPSLDLSKIIDPVEEMAKASIGVPSYLLLDSMAPSMKMFYEQFISGYQASQSEFPFSEGDMIEFADWLFLWQQNSLGEWKHQNRNEIVKSISDLLQIWKQQQPIKIYCE